MRPFLLALCVVPWLAVSACSEQVPSVIAAHSTVSDALVAIASNDRGRERWTALYLLAEIEGRPEEVAKVERGCQRVESDRDRLFCAYWTYRRLQTAKAAKDYILAFPTSSESLAELFDGTLAVSMPIGLVDLIGNLAATDPAAYAVLSAASDAADGWIAELLSEALSRIERKPVAEVGITS